MVFYKEWDGEIHQGGKRKEERELAERQPSRQPGAKDTDKMQGGRNTVEREEREVIRKVGQGR